MIIRYEPTFEGLLSAIALCMHDRVIPEALIPDSDQQTLLPCVDAPLVPDIRRRFRAQMAKRMNPGKAEQVFKIAWHAYLSDDEGIGLAIYRYLAAALRRRDDPSGDLLDKDIARVVRMAKKTSRQSHAFLGLLRFRTIAPSLYLADFSPDHHVLPLILPHFCERLPDQCFVIRDLRRGLAALHLPHRAPRIFVLAPPGEDAETADPLALASAMMAGVERQLALPIPAGAAQAAGAVQATGAANITAGATGTVAGSKDAESGAEAEPDPAALAMVAATSRFIEDFDEMWRRYLAALTIPERRNLRLQRAHMPKKYWKYLTEQPGA